MKRNLFFFIACTIGLFSFAGPITTQAATLNAEYKGQEIVDHYNTVVETKDNPYLRYESSAVDGGWWRRGLCGIYNISNYKHYTRQGHGSCENGFGQFSEGPWADPNEWSESSVLWSPWGNKAYYNYR